MRLPLLCALTLLATACGSSESTTTPEDAATETTTTDDTGATTDSGSSTEDTGAAGDTAIADDTGTATDAPTDTPVDAPDWSMVDPLKDAPMVTKVQGGFEFTEGTTWNAAGGFLLFTDIPRNNIHKLVPPSTVTVFRNPSGNANGLGWDEKGLLIACEHGNRRVSRTNADGMVVTVVDRYEGKRFNSPNDNIVRSDGTIYFTDPDYGLAGRPRELMFKGVFRVDKAGAVHLIDDKMNQPNGVALSPDEKLLYVSDSAAGLVNKWTVNTDGTVTGRTKFTDTGGGGDGMAMDDAGNLYVTTSAGVKVYKPGGGTWGTISVPEGPTNCAFGGADRKTLYISARSSIYRVALNIPGKP